MTQLTQLLCESEAQCINNNSFYPSLLRELTRCLKGTNYISVASMSCLCVSTYWLNYVLLECWFTSVINQEKYNKRELKSITGQTEAQLENWFITLAINCSSDMLRLLSAYSREPLPKASKLWDYLTPSNGAKMILALRPFWETGAGVIKRMRRYYILGSWCPNIGYTEIYCLFWCLSSCKAPIVGQQALLLQCSCSWQWRAAFAIGFLCSHCNKLELIWSLATLSIHNKQCPIMPFFWYI